MVRRELAAAWIACIIGAIVGACTSFGTQDGPLVADAGVAAPTRPVDAAAADVTSERPLDCDGAAFCDGFERDANDVRGPWTDLRKQEPDTVTLTTRRAKDGKTALRYLIGASPPTDHTVLTHEVPREAKDKRVRLAFSFYPESFHEDSHHYNLGFLYFNANGSSVTLYMIENGVSLYVSTPTDKHDRLVSGDVAFGRWHDAVMEVDIAAATVTVSLNGKQLVSGEPANGASIGGSTRVGVGIGPDFSDFAKPVTVDFDSVRVDLFQ